MDRIPRSLTIVLTLVLLIGLGSCSTSSPSPDAETESSESQERVSTLADSDLLPVGDSPQRGADNAWVTVVVFADFQCPFGARLAATLDDVYDAYDDGVVRLVFKHLPGDEPSSDVAARAAQAADNQGQFWAMHDLLFDHISELRGDGAESTVMALANELIVDEEQFRRDMESSQLAERVEDDRQLAADLNVDTAPAVFVSGGFIPGARSEGVYHRAIQNVFEVLREGVDTGEIDRRDVYRDSVETLLSHTGPEAAPEQPAASPVSQVPIDDGNPDTSDIDEATVNIAAFVSFGDDSSLELQRQLASLGEDDPVRITYFHHPRGSDASSRLAHRALEGTASSDEVLRLLEWLSDDDHLWRDDPQLLRDFLADEDITPVDDESFDDALASDIEMAQQHEVFGTPTTFVNGIRFVGVPDSQRLGDVIDEQQALAQRIASIQQVSGAMLYEEMVEGNFQRYGEDSMPSR